MVNRLKIFITDIHIARKKAMQGVGRVWFKALFERASLQEFQFRFNFFNPNRSSSTSFSLKKSKLEVCFMKFMELLRGYFENTVLYLLMKLYENYPPCHWLRNIQLPFSLATTH
jgi:hypothetical protein